MKINSVIMVTLYKNEKVDLFPRVLNGRVAGSVIDHFNHQDVSSVKELTLPNKMKSKHACCQSVNCGKSIKEIESSDTDSGNVYIANAQ